MCEVETRESSSPRLSVRLLRTMRDEQATPGRLLGLLSLLYILAVALTYGDFHTSVLTQVSKCVQFFIFVATDH